MRRSGLGDDQVRQSDRAFRRSAILEVLSGQFAPGQALIIVIDDGLHTPHSKQRLNCTMKEIDTEGKEADQVSILVRSGIENFVPAGANRL